MASLQNVKLPNKGTAPYELNDTKKGYKIQGTTGDDKISFTENTKSSTINLNKGKDSISFPKPLDAYNVGVDKQGKNVTFTDKVTKQAFTFTLNNKDVDDFSFKNGTASLSYDGKAIQFGKLNLAKNQMIDLKKDGSKVGLISENNNTNNATSEVTLKLLGTDIVFNEDAGKQAFITAQLSQPLTKPLTFKISSEDISTQGKLDFKPLVNKSFTISKNKTEVKIPVALINDQKSFELDEQFALKITKISNPAVKLAQDKIVVTIHDTTPNPAENNNTGNTTQPNDNDQDNQNPTTGNDNTKPTDDTKPNDNTSDGNTTVPNGNVTVINLDKQGTQDKSFELDAGSGAFNFVDNVSTANFVAIKNFGADDTITVVGSSAKAYDNGISFDGQNSTIIYNNNGQVNKIDIIGVDGFTYDVASFNAQSFGDILFQ